MQGESYTRRRNPLARHLPHHVRVIIEPRPADRSIQVLALDGLAGEWIIDRWIFRIAYRKDAVV